MSIQHSNYDETKIQSLRRHLELSANEGQARYYEVYVDNFKIIPKTNLLEQFSTYEDHIGSQTESLKITLFPPEGSHEKEHYVFDFKPKTNNVQGLNGLGETLGETIQKELNKERKVWELDLANKEIADLKLKLSEAENYLTELTQIVQDQKANGNKIGKIHLGDIVSVALEGMVRRNPQIVAKIPGASGLAGLIDQDNQRLKETPETIHVEASFKKKKEQAAKTEDEQFFLDILSEMQAHFNQQQLEKVVDILDALSHHPDKLDAVLALIETPTA